MVKNIEVKLQDCILHLETGKIATQTESSVVATVGGTVLLITIATQKPKQPVYGMLPLTVYYTAPFYAAGRFPGGFNKRETKPSDPEVIEARLIDRGIRPLFPEGFSDEIQIIAKCLSYDGINEPSSFAITATSAALRLSSLPFKKPIAGVRVGEIDGKWVLNPSFEEMKKSSLDLVIAGSSDDILMVECGANEYSEEKITDALFWGHSHIQKTIEQIEQWTAPLRKPVVEHFIKKSDKSAEIKTWLAQFTQPLTAALNHKEKKLRNNALNLLREQVNAAAHDNLSAWELEDSKSILEELREMQRAICRKSIIDHNIRIDGRDAITVRPITIEAGLLPNTHGSALFTRGETQALVITTLGGDRDAQTVDGIHGDLKERFMLHYSFPPYSVGECGMIGSPKRREIGHGRLARRALMPLLPDDETFPYVIRIASEITSCNGSSSMATVCGSSLALFDAGVPLKSAVSGIAMGLVKEGDKFVVLTDILGDEDAYGDMDFKVAGTSNGITALQMDIKIDGLSREIFEAALRQSHQGRMHILEQMNQILPNHRTDVAENAPKVITFSIKSDKIRDVIGKGGAVIKDLCERYQITIDISDTGVIKIGTANGPRGEEAKAHILSITKEIEINEVYQGQVTKIMDFGAFISLIPGKDGFLHISEISDQRVADINEHLSRGQKVSVKVLEIDQQQRVRVTMRNIDQTA